MDASIPGFIAAGFGVLMVIGAFVQLRHVDRVVEVEKDTSLTKWGASLVTRERVGCASILVCILGFFVIVGGLWAAAAAQW